MFGDPLENLWKTCIFDLCGVKEFHRKNFSVEVTSTEEERKGWLDGGGRNCRPSIPGRQLGRRTQHAERGR
jgi:hypothetical protein